MNERLRDAGKSSESSVLVDNFHSVLRAVWHIRVLFSEILRIYRDFSRFISCETNCGTFKELLNCGRTDFFFFFHREKTVISEKRGTVKIKKIRKITEKTHFFPKTGSTSFEARELLHANRYSAKIMLLANLGFYAKFSINQWNFYVHFGCTIAKEEVPIKCLASAFIQWPCLYCSLKALFFILFGMPLKKSFWCHTKN